MRSIEYIVTEQQSGKTAGEFLRCFHGYSRRMITSLKQNEAALSINGTATVRMDTAVETNDRLVVTLRAEPQGFYPNPSLVVPAVYEDEDVIVFNKPPGVPVHPSHRHLGDTLANVFAARCEATGREEAFHAINRLDRDTSGLCVVAKHRLAAARLSGGVQKVYYAVAEGFVTPEEGILSFPIARAGESIILRRVDSAGKPAVTHYRVLEQRNDHSLLELHLETGRTHQIRVHFSHIGHPLAGDDLYGGHRARITRQALHCGEVCFLQPVTGEEVLLRAGLPEDMQGTLHT